MPKILVTGANGQLGNEIRMIVSNYLNFDFIFTDIDELDITKFSDIQNFYSDNKFDYIINCAAYTNVDKAENDTINAQNINANAVKNLAEISCQYQLPLIHISTDYVFDGESNIQYTEDAETHPQSVYGITKLKGEEFAKNAYRYFIIRTSWLYSSFGQNFVKTMLRLGKEEDEINVVYDQIGSPTYAADLAVTVLEIALKTFNTSEKNLSGVYHFSNEGSCSWSEFASEIMTVSKLNCKVNPVLSESYPTIAKRPKYSLLDKSKIKETFGIKIPFWKDSLKNCLLKMNENI
ncbi:MAG: dTDP-4-dehydrorhamnose reductase [Bacteroidetes bacterium]|nr:MAG: dTDP-4-dehydrorhamnose reductase [Bacteroidota bacterium]